MAEEFHIEKVVVGVPTRFVVLDGVRMDWDRFMQDMEVLKKLEGTTRSAEGLNRRWLQAWEGRGVVKRFHQRFGDQYEDTWVEMVGKGPEHARLMAALAAFERKLAAEQAEAAREARREALQKELAALEEADDLVLV